MAKNKFKARQVIDAIRGTGKWAQPEKRTGCMGVVAVVAQRLGCTWHTAARYCHHDSSPYKSTAKAFEDEVEGSLDFSETQMLKMIAALDGPMIRYHLSTRGKHRGYTERQEHIGQLTLVKGYVEISPADWETEEE